LVVEFSPRWSTERWTLTKAGAAAAAIASAAAAAIGATAETGGVGAEIEAEAGNAKLLFPKAPPANSARSQKHPVRLHQLLSLQDMQER
jgi:hypothetical protein